MITALGATGFDVVVVGLGPTGATLTNLLGLCGLRVLAVERFKEPYALPRAVHFDDEVMRAFQTVGVAGEIANIVRVNVGMRFVDADGELLLDWPRPRDLGPQGWHASYRFHQPELERILRNALRDRENVTVRAGCDVLGVSGNPDHAELEYVDRETGAHSIVHADFIVGCDGANSVVRRCMNTTETDLGFKERWLVADLLLRRPKPELGDHTIQYCIPRRPATYARGPGNRRRWEIAIRDDEHAGDICKPASVWKLLERWISPDEAEIERAAVYSFQSIIANKWRSGRLSIAGDAAHRTPPFMGQGMCAGIRDAVNLAWKLSMVVGGRTSASLLETYGSERIPHVRAYIETAIRLGRLINASGTRAVLDSAFRHPDGTVRMESISPALGPGLGSSGDKLRGTLFPQPRIGEGGKLDDLIGYGAALVIRDVFLRGNQSAIDEMAESGGIPVVTDTGNPEIADWLASNGRMAVIVRPDRYILGTADTRGELTALFREFDCL